MKISGKNTATITLENVDMAMLEKQLQTLRSLVFCDAQTSREELDDALGLLDMFSDVMAEWDDIHGKIYGKE